ncbi:hypothetical protein D910_04674 [Dendroctonus ponderosae]|uniref:Uncharacterized protein n=1 Tax=Dendroctonus ponderosae TaxID=77166 RepID=U4U4K4_DENPD|nr:hypothetical protein D910_04674 [Dendroctonus ponderosae]
MTRPPWYVRYQQRQKAVNGYVCVKHQVTVSSVGLRDSCVTRGVRSTACCVREVLCWLGVLTKRLQDVPIVEVPIQPLTQDALRNQRRNKKRNWQHPQHAGQSKQPSRKSLVKSRKPPPATAPQPKSNLPPQQSPQRQQGGKTGHEQLTQTIQAMQAQMQTFMATMQAQMIVLMSSPESEWIPSMPRVS